MKATTTPRSTLRGGGLRAAEHPPRAVADLWHFRLRISSGELGVSPSSLYYANSRLRRYRRLKNTLAMLLPSVATE